MERAERDRITNPTAGGGWATIPAMTMAAAARFEARIAIYDGETQLSYTELGSAARTFGAALVASGVGRGDRVAIWAFNSAEWVVAALGIFHAGAVLVPINTRFKGGEAADLLARSHARVLVTVTGFLKNDYVAMLEASSAELPELATIVVASGAAPVGTVPWGEFLASATDDGRAEVDRRSAELGTDDPSDILFTSGTTGVSKGVVHTHGRTLRIATDYAELADLSGNDRYLMVNPYFHMFGLKAGILATVAVGATMLPEAVFDVDRVLTRVAQERVTQLPGPPTLYQGILSHPDREKYDLSSLRGSVTGSTDIPVDLIRRFTKEVPTCTLMTGYGLTEAGTVAVTGPDDDPETVATTVGRPRPCLELRLIDESGRGVAPGEPGEILVRGDSVMSHYLDDPEATAATLSADGWLRTGDLGILDELGQLRIVGRAKDMFIVGGFNAYPAEIENSLARHPDIQQAAVIGIPDERLGEIGMAFVVPRPGTTASGAQIIAWARAQVANYKVPRVVEIVDDLPLNATGKVMKSVLRERAVRARAGRPRRA